MCFLNILQKDLDKHFSIDCQQHRCKYHQQGCLFRGSFDKIQEHEKEIKIHFCLLDDFCQRQRKNISNGQFIIQQYFNEILQPGVYLDVYVDGKWEIGRISSFDFDNYKDTTRMHLSCMTTSCDDIIISFQRMINVDLIAGYMEHKKKYYK